MKIIQESITAFLHVLLFQLLSVADATIYAYNTKNETSAFDDLEANFGPGVNAEGLVGVLLSAEPHDACTDIKPPPFLPDFNTNVTIVSFVLIARGTCDFALKVFNAQKAGYRAAIVHNVGSNTLIRMSSGKPSIESEIYTPSVFVGEDTAIQLNKTFLYNSGASPYIQLYEGSFNPLDYYLLPFVIVIAVCFVSLLCFLLIKCLRDRRRARRGRLSLQRLKKLPVKKFDKGDEYDVCAICLDDYEEGDSLRILPCDHAYHCKCVDPWLTSSKRICPLCKRRVLSDDESSSSDGGGDTTDDERTPLAPSSVAASPNAPIYATGYGSRNPFTGRRQVRRVSSSSDDTTSTDVSDAEHEREPPRRRTPPRKTVTISLSNNAPQTSGYQSQQLSRPNEHKHEQGIVNPMMSAATNPDDYLDSAEAMMAGPSRVSESSITVLSDAETLASTSEPHSYSSQDFHSLDESTVDGLTPNQTECPRSSLHDSDQDDIVVIAQGSKSMLQGNDSEV